MLNAPLYKEKSSTVNFPLFYDLQREMKLDFKTDFHSTTCERESNITVKRLFLQQAKIVFVKKIVLHHAFVNTPLLSRSFCIFFMYEKLKIKIITVNAVCHAWKVTYSQFGNTTYNLFLYFSIDLFPARK